MTTISKEYIIPSDKLLQNGCPGALVMWRFAKPEVVRTKMVEAIKQAQLNVCAPAESTPEAALKYMLECLFKNKSTLISAVRGQVGAYAVVPQNSDEDRVKYEESWRASVHFVEYVPGVREAVALTSDNAPDEQANMVAAKYDYYKSLVIPAQLSSWMARVLKEDIGAMPAMVDGQYFVTPKTIEMWRKFGDVVRPFGIQTYEIPAMRTKEALELVLATLNKYVDETATNLEEEYVKYETKGKIQERVVRSRTEEIGDVLDRIEEIEGIIGERLNNLRDRMESIRVSYGNFAIAEGL